MQPVDLLFAEHRVIARMLTAVRCHLRRMRASGVVDVEFVDEAVDFVRTYGDRLHHGKEECILFRGLRAKRLPVALRKRIAELKAEHVLMRRQVTLLVAADELYVAGSRGAMRKVLEVLRTILAVQPAHIRKEERGFFSPLMKYLTERERADMVRRMIEFDRRVIHEKYEKWVDGRMAESSRCPRAACRAARRRKP